MYPSLPNRYVEASLDFYNFFIRCWVVLANMHLFCSSRRTSLENLVHILRFLYIVFIFIFVFCIASVFHKLLDIYYGPNIPSMYVISFKLTAGIGFKRLLTAKWWWSLRFHRWIVKYPPKSSAGSAISRCLQASSLSSTIIHCYLTPKYIRSNYRFSPIDCEFSN